MTGCADASRKEKAVSDLKAILEGPPPPSLPTTVVGEEEGVEGTKSLEAEQEHQNSKEQEHQSSKTAAAPIQDQRVLSGRMALLMHLLMLERAANRLEKIANYTATFFKQERVGGELSELQVMEMKVRHSPFSVYMKWVDGGDVGREILYVNGRYDGKMIVHVGGFKGRFLPSLSLNPNGSLAMEESRYPITRAGLLELVRMAIGYRHRDLQLGSGVNCCMLSDHKFDDRDCYCFTIEYENPTISETYRKSITYFDKALSIPIFMKNFTWPHMIDNCDESNLDESTIIEHYAFLNIDLERRLADTDFDRTNDSYGLRR